MGTGLRKLLALRRERKESEDAARQETARLREEVARATTFDRVLETDLSWDKETQVRFSWEFIQGRKVK